MAQNEGGKTMRRFAMALPIAAALCLGFASGSFANTDDQDWISFEQIFGGTSPPKSTADCAKFGTAAVRTECENRMNRGTTFTYRATGDNRQNAEVAAQKYCGMMGKTADVKGLTQNGDLLHYNCK
jgi:hypothetical protein